MYLFRFLLDRANEDYALIFPPLELMQIKRFSIVMKKSGFDVVPSDYVNFLTWSDGLVWHDLELFSIYSHERPDTIYLQPTLLEIQKKRLLGDAFMQKLVIGRASEELICFDTETKIYEILDRFSYKPLLKFPRFVDLLYFYIRQNGIATSPTETGS